MGTENGRLHARHGLRLDNLHAISTAKTSWATSRTALRCSARRSSSKYLCRFPKDTSVDFGKLGFGRGGHDEAEVRVLKANIDGEGEVMVPRANVEIIATGS